MNEQNMLGDRKKNITISIIIILALAFGFFLFKISPKQENSTQGNNFNFSQTEKLEKPLPVVETEHVKGDINAKNTLVVFEDFQCPACASINADLNKFALEIQDTKVVFRHFPLIQLHKNAVVAALASEAASAQGKFWEMKDKLFTMQAYWEGLKFPIDKFVEYAKEIGVADVEKFKKDIENETYKDRIQKNLTEAINLQLQGTPTLFFNGVLLKNMTFDGLKKQAEPLMNK
jgi:protein-disulfide isomerase